MTIRLSIHCILGFVWLLGCGQGDAMLDESSASKTDHSSTASSSPSSKHPSSPSAEATEQKSTGLAKITALSDAICACQDDACLDALEEKSKLALKVFTQDMMETYQSMDKVPADIVEAVNSARGRAGACAKKLLGPLYRAKRGGAIGELADRVCACQDLACLQAFEAEGKKAGDAFKAALLAKYKTKEAIPKDILNSVGTALERMRECEDKLRKPASSDSAKAQGGTATTVNLVSGGTLTLPAGTVKLKSIPPAKNGMAKTVYTNQDLGVGFSLGQQIPKGKTCAQWVRDDDKEGQENIRREGKDLHMILRPRVRKECDLQSTCIYREMGHRTAADFRDNKPYREGIGYSLCFGETAVALALVQFEPGKPMQVINREILETVVKSYLPSSPK